MVHALKKPTVSGRLQRGDEGFDVQVLAVKPYALIVAFMQQIPKSTDFDSLELNTGLSTVTLSACRFEAHAAIPQRRHDDPPRRPGHGSLVFLQNIYDFSALFRNGMVYDLQQKIKQLPLLWSRRSDISPAFRDYTAELLYDIQVYRSLFDEIDRNINREDLSAKEHIHRIVVGSEYDKFKQFYREKNAQLERLVAEFGKQEHEQHGFYFRKHVWDLILSSQFLSRTNLKPRGYAGDSAMMEMVYANDFRGDTIFAKFMHKFPVETAAAQAVRNRRQLIVDHIDQVYQRVAPHNGRLSILSVACGPARELADLVTCPADGEKYRFHLLDQDSQALAEAKQSVQQAEQTIGRPLEATYLRDSVRTMLRRRDLPQAFGTHHFVYALGLFDYLTQPVARTIARRFYELLKPGGEMLIGNYHFKNTTRIYMEYWADWVLCYRREEQLLALVKDLPGAECDIFFENTGCQMFLRVRKQ